MRSYENACLYPDDNACTETKIKEVSVKDDHYIITKRDGWTFLVSKEECDFEPLPKMKVRIYGRGLGSVMRGLFINGVEIFYRTEEEEREHSEISLYGKDAADWLSRWDQNKTVWSIAMGGFGPSYEQALQITMAEILRFLINTESPTKIETDEESQSLSKRIDEYSYKNKKIEELGLSGAQFGAAKWLAYKMYTDGPRAIMKDEQVKDRHIQISKYFPQG